MFKTLYRAVLVPALRLFGLAPALESRQLIREIIQLEQQLEAFQRELEELRMENKSLWDMLDELNSASTVGKGTVTDFLEELQDTVMEEMLKDFKPAGEA